MAPVTSVELDSITRIIDELDPPIRARKLSNRCALEELVYMLQSGVSWRHLRCRTCSHWTVYKRLQCWVKTGLLYEVWVIVLNHYANKKMTVDPHWFHELFIDSSMVKNISGVDCLGKNPTDRGRLATKHSAICDKAGVPVSSVFFKANQHDCTTTERAVEAISCRVKRDRRYSTVLVADKGYISRGTQAVLMKSRNIRLLTPHRCNARNHPKMSKPDRCSLHRRHKVENLFCRLDKFKRLHCRVDRFITVYEAFMQIACTLLTIQELNRG